MALAYRPADCEVRGCATRGGWVEGGRNEGVGGGWAVAALLRFVRVLGPPVLGPPVLGPPVLGPPVLGPPVLGPPVLGPPVLGPPVLGPPVLGPPVLGPPVLGPPVLGPPVLGPPVLGPPHHGRASRCSRRSSRVTPRPLYTRLRGTPAPRPSRVNAPHARARRPAVRQAAGARLSGAGFDRGQPAPDARPGHATAGPVADFEAGEEWMCSKREAGQLARPPQGCAAPATLSLLAAWPVTCCLHIWPPAAPAAAFGRFRLPHAPSAILVATLPPPTSPAAAAVPPLPPQHALRRSRGRRITCAFSPPPTPKSTRPPSGVRRQPATSS
eukprot:scaffold2033_cov85-Isochrysis_galbana.AAC.1